MDFLGFFVGKQMGGFFFEGEKGGGVVSADVPLNRDAEKEFGFKTLILVFSLFW